MEGSLLHERNKQPSAGVLNSQTVKAPLALERGNDANKKITGRKRHIAVDTDGRLLVVNLTSASSSDSAGAASSGCTQIALALAQATVCRQCL